MCDFVTNLLGFCDSLVNSKPVDSAFSPFKFWLRWLMLVSSLPSEILIDSGMNLSTLILILKMLSLNSG